jgi:hypothetical protein
MTEALLDHPEWTRDWCDVGMELGVTLGWLEHSVALIEEGIRRGVTAEMVQGYDPIDAVEAGRRDLALLLGALDPADAAERLALAALAVRREEYARALAFYEQALADAPRCDLAGSGVVADGHSSWELLLAAAEAAIHVDRGDGYHLAPGQAVVWEPEWPLATGLPETTEWCPAERRPRLAGSSAHSDTLRERSRQLAQRCLDALASSLEAVAGSPHPSLDPVDRAARARRLLDHEHLGPVLGADARRALERVSAGPP